MKQRKRYQCSRCKAYGHNVSRCGKTELTIAPQKWLPPNSSFRQEGNPPRPTISTIDETKIQQQAPKQVEGLVRVENVAEFRKLVFSNPNIVLVCDDSTHNPRNIGSHHYNITLKSLNSKYLICESYYPTLQRFAKKNEVLIPQGGQTSFPEKGTMIEMGNKGEMLRKYLIFANQETAEKYLAANSGEYLELAKKRIAEEDEKREKQREKEAKTFALVQKMYKEKQRIEKENYQKNPKVCETPSCTHILSYADSKVSPALCEECIQRKDFLRRKNEKIEKLTSEQFSLIVRTSTPGKPYLILTKTTDTSFTTIKGRLPKEKLMEKLNGWSNRQISSEIKNLALTSEKFNLFPSVIHKSRSRQVSPTLRVSYEGGHTGWAGPPQHTALVDGKGNLLLVSPSCAFETYEFLRSLGKSKEEAFNNVLGVAFKGKGSFLHEECLDFVEKSGIYGDNRKAAQVFVKFFLES